MSLIVLEQATLGFGGRVILGGENLALQEGDRVGLVGPNGSGKSTLLRVITGTQLLDGGEVRRAKAARIGYLPQDISELPGDTLLGSVLSTVPGRAEIEERRAERERELREASSRDEQLRLATDLAELQESIDYFETYYSERQAERILRGLGFRPTDFGRPTDELSGGWKMRAALAGLLFCNPDVVLLDEPTNHLDVPSVHWLGSFLAQCGQAMVLVCHDREFLNAQINRVIALEPEGIRTYRGDYDAYLEQRETEAEQLEAETRRKERELKEMQRFVERFRAKATKARQAQSRAKRAKKLQKELEGKRRPGAAPALSFSFPPTPRCNREALKLEGVSKRFGSLELYRGVTKSIYAGDRIAIIGVNGAGKTTLLKLLAGELAPDSGGIHRGEAVQLGYYAQHHTEQLHRESTILQEVWRVAPERGETAVRSVCGAFLFSGDDVDKPVSILSGGERARVLLAQHLLRPGNVLLMDEPTNHLDIASAEALTQALATYDGTLVFVSHTSSFVNRLAAKVWDIVDGSVVEHHGNLDDYFRRMRSETSSGEEVEPRSSSGSRPRAVGGQVGKSSEGSGGYTGTALRGEEKQGADGLSRQDRRAGKRREAEARNAYNRERRRLQSRVTQLEGRIQVLEDAKRSLEPMLADPEVARDPKRFGELLDQYQTKGDKLEELYGRWETEQAALQHLESKNERT